MAFCSQIDLDPTLSSTNQLLIHNKNTQLDLLEVLRIKYWLNNQAEKVQRPRDVLNVVFTTFGIY